MDASKLWIDRVKGHTFLKKYLNVDGTVVDLGMNHGDFAGIMHAKYGCSVVGVEANPTLAQTADKQNGIRCKNAAISGSDGFVKFSINPENLEASTIVEDDVPLSETTVQVQSVALSTFLKEADTADIDLLKVDVEGAELDVIESTEADVFRRCTQIAIEFHSFIYPWQTERVEKAIAWLSGLGFYHTDFSTNRTDVLFINNSRIPISAAGKALLKAQKYRSGIVRRARRIAHLPVE